MSEFPVVGVGVALVNDDQILLIKRGREPGRGLWAVPGGKVKLGEGLKEARGDGARRRSRRSRLGWRVHR